MKPNHSIGDVLTTTFRVEEHDLAAFHGEPVHEVCSTFALGREAEWACRQFVLAMREEHEEGIGCGLRVDHLAPAFAGQQVVVAATLVGLEGSLLTCTWEAKVDERVIAKGLCEQRLWPRTRIAAHWNQFRPGTDPALVPPPPEHESLS